MDNKILKLSFKDEIEEINSVTTFTIEIKEEPELSIDAEEVPCSENDWGAEESEPQGKKIARRRKLQPHMHKKFIAQENVERGRERITKTGKIIPGKKFIPQSICKCKTYCSRKISIARQHEIFSTYYEQSNKSQKTLLIRASIKKTPIASKRDPFLPIIPRKSKEFNYKYFLTDSNGIKQEVCRSFMLGCYQITASSMCRAVKSAESNPHALEKRGKGPPANRISETLKQGVRNFINRFPKYESHYGRSDSEKKYLNSNLNLAVMYRMYKDDCEATNVDLVSEHMFRHIFNYEFNLSFKKRHTDTCKTCDMIKVNLDNEDLSNEERIKFENMQEEHDDLRKKIHAEFERDIVNANEDTIVLTFSFQKVLETPSVTTSIAFYKRQLATYNLCIVNEISNQAYMYMWSEDVAARGGQEVASCLRKHFQNHVPECVKHVILYSDPCEGQNRNIKITLLLKHYLANSSIDLIEEKFLLSGHSYNSCDRNFVLIEKERKRHKTVNTPDHWIDIIKNTKKKEPFFKITKMQSTDFFSSQVLQKLIVNQKQDLNYSKINWMKIRAIKLDREQPFHIFMTFDGEILRDVDIAKKEFTEEEYKEADLLLLYPNGRPITKHKYNDLMQLIQFIDRKYKPFYQTLRVENSSKDFDFDLASGDSDEE